MPLPLGLPNIPVGGGEEEIGGPEAPKRRRRGRKEPLKSVDIICPECGFQNKGLEGVHPDPCKQCGAEFPDPKQRLLQQEGNPTFAIQQNYDELMSITDHQELINRVTEVIIPTFGRDSENQQKFERIVATKPNLASLQQYLTNFMLAGSGMGVGRFEDVEGLASAISEDVNDPVKLTPYQNHLTQLVGKYGYITRLL